MELTGKCKENFVDWYFKTYHTYPTDINYWLEEDKLRCYSLFFGYTIDTVNRLKKAVELYNSNYETTRT